MLRWSIGREQWRFGKTVFCVLSMVFAAMSATGSPPSFQGLGDLPGSTYYSIAEGLSADGTVVVGVSNSAASDPYGEAFRWTQAGGMVGLGDLPGSTAAYLSSAHGVSGNGQVVVGESYATGNTAMRWTQASGMVSLGDLSGTPGDNFHESRAWASSFDGSVVVGRGSSPSAEAFRWTQAGGLVGLGDLPGGSTSSQASGVSADGSIIVGYGYSASGREAFRWTEAGGLVGLGDIADGDFASWAVDISTDAEVIVGWGTSAAGQEAMRWTQAGGMVGLGDLPGGAFHSSAAATNQDGSVIVGYSSTSGTGTGLSTREAFLWDATFGMRDLRDVLVGVFHLDLTGWVLRQATSVSDDGLTFVGWGINPSGNTEAWIASLPALGLPGDYNANGVVDAADYAVWRNNVGAPAGTLPNDAVGGPIGQPQYDTWRANFGHSAGGGTGAAASAAVPEPAGWLLLLVGALAMRGCNCRGPVRVDPEDIL